MPNRGHEDDPLRAGAGSRAAVAQTRSNLGGNRMQRTKHCVPWLLFASRMKRTAARIRVAVAMIWIMLRQIFSHAVPESEAAGLRDVEHGDNRLRKVMLGLCRKYKQADEDHEDSEDHEAHHASRTLKPKWLLFE